MQIIVFSGDGTYQFALENYPKIQEWELEKLAKFIAYEQDHHRQTIVECENHELKYTNS